MWLWCHNWYGWFSFLSWFWKVSKMVFEHRHFRRIWGPNLIDFSVEGQRRVLFKFFYIRRFRNYLYLLFHTFLCIWQLFKIIFIYIFIFRWLWLFESSSGRQGLCLRIHHKNSLILLHMHRHHCLFWQWFALKNNWLFWRMQKCFSLNFINLLFKIIKFFVNFFFKVFMLKHVIN